MLLGQCLEHKTPESNKSVVQLLDKVYANGVRVAKKAFRKIEERLERHASLPKYGVRIQPQGG